MVEGRREKEGERETIHKGSVAFGSRASLGESKSAGGLGPSSSVLTTLSKREIQAEMLGSVRRNGREDREGRVEVKDGGGGVRRRNLAEDHRGAGSPKAVTGFAAMQLKVSSGGNPHHRHASHYDNDHEEEEVPHRNAGNLASSRNSTELRGQSEYIKVKTGTEILSDDQLDRLLHQTSATAGRINGGR